jgi:sortase (surface protein transpeptidase)
VEKLICFFLNVGDVVDIQLSGGQAKRYQVVETSVVPMGEAQSGFTHKQERLTLVTKFPFDSQDATNRMLYVVAARRISDSVGFIRPPARAKE